MRAEATSSHERMFTLREAYALMQRMRIDEFMPGGIREADVLGGVRLGSVGEVATHMVQGVRCSAKIATVRRLAEAAGARYLLVIGPSQDAEAESPWADCAELVDAVTTSDELLVWGRPWLQQSEVVGLVCADALARADGAETVSSVMQPVIAVDAEASTYDAAGLLDQHDLDFAPVTSGGLIVGIVRRADLGGGPRVHTV